MPSGALIDTSNRLLGWSTNDFSLYGGQAAVTIGPPAASPRLSDGLSIPDPAADAHGASPHPTAVADTSAPGDALPSQADAPSAFHATPFAPAPIQSGDLTHASGAGTEAVFGMPVAAGSASQLLPFETLHAPLAGSSFTPPTLAAEQPEIQALSIAPPSGLTAPILAVTDGFAHAVTSVATAADTLLADTQHAVDTLPNVTDALFHDSALTSLDGFMGSDPVAGVATLVSMVDSTDAFDLSHAGLDIPQLSTSGSILDTLTDDATAGALLGDVAHQADTLVPDHHHDGVLGIL